MICIPAVGPKQCPLTSMFGFMAFKLALDLILDDTDSLGLRKSMSGFIVKKGGITKP